jgi:hypothetical protein
LSIFCSKNGLEQIFKYFLFQKWFRKEFRVFFSFINGSESNSEVFSSEMVWKGIPRFYHSKMVWNGIPRVFHFFSSK